MNLVLRFTFYLILQPYNFRARKTLWPSWTPLSWLSKFPWIVYNDAREQLQCTFCNSQQLSKTLIQIRSSAHVHCTRGWISFRSWNRKKFKMNFSWYSIWISGDIFVDTSHNHTFYFAAGNSSSSTKRRELRKVKSAVYAQNRKDPKMEKAARTGTCESELL